MMTFSEYLKTEKGKTLYQGIVIDDATREDIFDWFQFREVADDEKFYAYFRRKLDINIRRYNQLVRVDLTEIDPLVASYHERELKHFGDITGKGQDTTERKKTGSDVTLTENSGRDNSYSNRTPDITTTAKASGTSGGKQLSKNAPQSLSYEGAMDFPEQLDWQYASAQQEQKGTSKNDSTTTNTGNEEVEGYTEYGHNTKTTTTPGVTETDTATKGSGQEYNLTDHEITTGRDGLTPQDALMKMREYIRGTNAFEWLKYKLEPCFLAIYDV